MPTKSNKRGGSDRKRIATGQEWEMSYLRDKFNVSTQQITGAVRAVGNSRKKVEEYLQNRSK